jgi:hypothetical protein
MTCRTLDARPYPEGRATVPDAVKAELLQNIRKFLQP